MFFPTKDRFVALWFVAIVFAANTALFAAYNGSETWLHYYAVPVNMKAEYQSVCKSLVLGDAASDTLKNAKAEFDLAIPKMLGGTALPATDGAGAIVLAPQGSSLVASAGIDYTKVTDEGFIIKSSGGKTFITGKNQIAVLRGAFHFLRLMQTAKNIANLDIVENPYFAFRVLDHWYNHYGSNPDTERVYGGNRVFNMENFGNLSAAERTRIIDYCRMAVSQGLNGMCPDNVNTYRGGGLGNYKCLEVSNLKTQKIFADLIGTYGLKYFLSVSYASPRLVTPKISTANAFADATAKKWWFDKVDTVRVYIKNFGGFLMKADSEGEEGPRSSYGLNQSQGANPMAEALKRYGHVLIWRTFIYDTSDPDFFVCQSKEFAGQTWDGSVILRTKDGPRDFQVVEPPNQLLGLSGVRHGMEFQVTQEYTGQAIHVCWLVPKWKQILDWDIKGAPLPPGGAAGTMTHQLLRGAGTAAGGGGVWGISNFSDTVNWTGQFLAQANSYGYGRLAWNPTLSADQIVDEWIRCSFDNGNDPAILYIVGDILKRSWKTYEDYTISYSALMPALENDSHYEINFLGMRNSRFFTPYFMNFIADGIGVDRTTKATYYPAALADSFSVRSKCPEDYLLFFHHLNWDYVMKSGMTLIQNLHYNHYRGIHRLRKFINNWNLLKTVSTVDETIHAHVLAKLNLQFTDASRWVNTFRNDFGTYYTTAVPCNLVIIPPDSTKAVATAVGGTVNLSVKLMDQKGVAVTTETIKWKVVEPGASLTAAEGTSTVFSASANGVYTVIASTAKWPDLTEELQIFVGSWATGTNREIARRAAPLSLQIIQGPRSIVVKSPIAGTICVVSLQGRIVKSIAAGKPGSVVWDTRGAAGGLYLLKVQNKTQTLQGKLFVQ